MSAYWHHTWEEYVRAEVEAVKAREGDNWLDELPGCCMRKEEWEDGKRHYSQVLAAVLVKKEKVDQ